MLRVELEVGSMPTCRKKRGAKINTRGISGRLQPVVVFAIVGPVISVGRVVYNKGERKCKTSREFLVGLRKQNGPAP
jgi:hypothetical protein